MKIRRQKSEVRPVLRSSGECNEVSVCKSGCYEKYELGADTAEGGKKLEIRNPSSGFGLRASFGSRISGFGFLLLLGLCQPTSLLACAACYGQSDSAMAKGMNWGILTLLGVVVMVLAGVCSFFVFIAKRQSAARTPQSTDPGSRNTEHESLLTHHESRNK